MNAFILKMYLIPLSVIAMFFILLLLLVQIGRVTSLVSDSRAPRGADDLGQETVVAELSP